MNSKALFHPLIASGRVNWTILRISVEERLVYRGDFAFATLMRFLPIVTQIFLWGAIYKIDSDGGSRVLNGYTYSNMVAYYLLAMVGRAFSSMPGLATGIALEVRDGGVKKYLTQPVDMLGYLFWHRVAHKLVYYVVATAPFALVFFLCRSYLPGWPDAMVTTAWVLSLIMAFLVGYLMESLIGLIAFWFLEVESLIFIFMMLNYFLSGHMLPLDWLPAPISTWVQYLPFKYLAYFPAAVFLGRFTHEELLWEIVVEIGWIVVLFVLARLAFARGVRRYSAFGG